MVNEEKFTKVKKVMAARHAMHKVKDYYWNPKKISTWFYWGALIIFCIGLGKKAFIEAVILASLFVNGVALAIVYYIRSNWLKQF